MNPRSLIQDWIRDKQAPMALGITLYQEYGHKMAVKRMLPGIKRKRLEIELQLSLQTPTLQQHRKPSFSIQTYDEWKIAPDPEEPVEKTVAIQGDIIRNIETEPTAEHPHELESENARLYSQRALLSNRLKDTGGEEAIRLENVRIIQEIQQIVEKMKANRKAIRRMKGSEGIPVAPEEVGDKIVVYLKDAQYTLPQLQALDYEAINKLREKVRQQMAKSRQRIDSSKTSKFKIRNEQKFRIKEQELALIDRIRKTQKYVA